MKSSVLYGGQFMKADSLGVLKLNSSNETRTSAGQSEVSRVLSLVHQNSYHIPAEEHLSKDGKISFSSDS